MDSYRRDSDTSEGDISIDDGNDQEDRVEQTGIRHRKIVSYRSAEEPVIEINDCDYFNKIALLILTGIVVVVILLASSKRELPVSFIKQSI